MKTILIPIYSGMRARNFFRSKVYEDLAADPEIKLAIIVPPSKVDYYREEFKEKDVVFEALEIISEPKFGIFLYDLAFNLLDTETMRSKQWLDYHRYGNWFKFFLRRALLVTLGPVKPVHRMIRFLDRFVALDPNVVALFKKYNVDMVLVPDIVFPPDRIFLRAAKRKKLPVLGMVRSWDNLTSKGVIQVLPDKLLVQTTIMKGEAIKYAGMKEENIVMTGIPYYDNFIGPRKNTREEFCKKIGVSPNKRFLLCAPFFEKYTGSAVVIVNELVKAIEDGRLPKDLHILVRSRPATPKMPSGMMDDSPHVTITKPCSNYFPVKGIQTQQMDWEFTDEDLEFLLDSLYYSDVVINTISTLGVDAAAFDKPVITVRFDADPDCPPRYSVNFAVKLDHYKRIDESGGSRLVWNMDELIAATAAYLKDPSLDREGRKRICDEQIEFFDGQSGKRIADYVKKFLAEKTKSA